ncbi:MAG TPA: hypothetical protein VK978_04385 [Candidatus Saccharimonadales bacterium]|nr:hypothetical protein [Candidatus Saccharimonadales bacterium]
MKLFTKDRNLTPSWGLLPKSLRLLRRHITEVMYLNLIPSLILTLGVILIGDDSLSQPVSARESLGILLTITGLLLTLLVTPGFLLMQTRAVKGKAVHALRDFKDGLGSIGAMIGYSAILFFGCMVALVFISIGVFSILAATGQTTAASSTDARATTLILSIFALTVLVFIRFFALAPFYIVDKNVEPADSLRLSYKETKGVSRYMWGTVGVLLVFLIPAIAVSMRFPGIGNVLSTFFVLPYTFALALRYGEIAHKDKNNTV